MGAPNTVKTAPAKGTVNKRLCLASGEICIIISMNGSSGKNLKNPTRAAPQSTANGSAMRYAAVKITMLMLCRFKFNKINLFLLICVIRIQISRTQKPMHTSSGKPPLKNGNKNIKAYKNRGY